MKVTVLCSDARHPVNRWLATWAARHAAAHEMSLLRAARECPGGDVLFLVSCTEIVRPEVRTLYRHAVVLHASDLPAGRGWSPHIWDVVEGRTHLTLSMLAVADPFDTGDVWQKRRIELDGTELYDEINRKVFDAEIELMDWLLANADGTRPVPQTGTPSVRRRRTPEDSRVDPARSIETQFDLLRVCDPERFPAFFDLRGARYEIVLRKVRSPGEGEKA